MRIIHWVRAAIKQGYREMSSVQGWPWFRFGYQQAITDIREGRLELNADPATVRQRMNQTMEEWVTSV